MAEEVGGIVYEVGMEVKGLQAGGATVNKVLQDIEKSIDDSIAGINKLDTELKSAGETAVKAGKNLSGLNNAMRQGGYQIQDFIVQVQGGQSALVALSQQGSQLLGVFGTGGAVAGALLTIGTVIVGSLIAGMDNAAVSTKALTAAQQRLADIFQVSANGVVVLSDKFAKLADVSENAARSQLTMALIDANNIIKASVQGVNELGDALGTWKAPLSAAISQMDALKARGMDVNQALKELGGTYEGNIVGLNQLNQVVGEVSKEFGISADDAVKLVQALADVRQNANPETIAALRDVTVDLSQKYGYANKALSEFTGKVGEYSIQSDQAAESTRLATDMLNGHKIASEEDARATEENTKRLQSYIQAIKDEGATIAFTARQKALYRAEQMGANETDKQEINASFDKIEAYKQQVAQQKEQQKETKKLATASASAAKQQESVAQKLEQLRQKSLLTAESTRELSREQSILAAQQSLGKGATQEQINLAGQYAAKAWDNANALKAQAEAEKQRVEAVKGFAALKSQTSPMFSVETNYQKDLAALNAYAVAYPQKIAEVEQARAAIEGQYRQQRLDAMWQEWSQQNAATQAAAAAFDAFGQTASNALTGVLTGSMSVSDALQSIGSTVLNAVINSFVQMGVEWLKSVIMGQVGMTAAAGMAAAQAQIIAAAMAPAAAMTSLATSGANAIPAQAGIVSTVGVAKAMSVAGALKNGGPAQAGSMYQVGENNLPEIFQASTGKQYMIPGDSGKVISNKDLTGGGSGIIIYNNVTNTSSGATTSSTARDNGDGSVTIETIVADIEAGGPISNAITSHTTATRRATE